MGVERQSPHHKNILRLPVESGSEDVYCRLVGYKYLTRLCTFVGWALPTSF